MQFDDFPSPKKKDTVEYGTVGAVIELSTAALRVACSIPARSKYLYDLHILVVPRLTVCVDMRVLNVCAPTTQLFLRLKKSATKLAAFVVINLLRSQLD